MPPTFRPETAADLEAIRQVHRLAFGQGAEANLVDALRGGEYVTLSLVAVQNGQIIGHILFSRLEIVSENRIVEAISLAPVAILPKHQGKGIGSALIRFGLDVARQAGHRIVIVVGDPGYYPRFGFSAEFAASLSSKYAGEAFMALELMPGALDGVVGDVRYPEPFERV